jgi:DNA polymerase I
MQIEIRKGLSLQQGTYNAVISPENVMVAALNSNADLQRFLFLYVSGNYSRILNGISRKSGNFEVRRAFTAHQLFTTLREAAHTVIFVEHDPTLFDGAAEMVGTVADALREAGRESLVILYTPVPDRTFSALARTSSHYIEILAIEPERPQVPVNRLMRQHGMRVASQRTLEVV